MCEICPKLTTKTPNFSPFSSVSVDDFEKLNKINRDQPNG